MSRVDWSLVKSELNGASPPKREIDRVASEPSEADLLKHIEDALRMDTTETDQTGAARRR